MELDSYLILSQGQGHIVFANNMSRMKRLNHMSQDQTFSLNKNVNGIKYTYYGFQIRALNYSSKDNMAVSATA